MDAGEIKRRDGPSLRIRLVLEPWKGQANIGHSGSTDGFSASLQRFPEAGLTVILLTNSDEFDIATKLAREIADLEMQNDK